MWVKPRMYEIIKCPHCDKIGTKPTMVRWHFDNCKLITDNVSGLI